ncbi:MAG: hypothetical protein ABSA59_17685, partial [Terriglobia bacterium]
MKFGRITAGLLVIGVLVGAPASTRAEEIILKNGQKIVGTIVGYEKDMFRVETEYGIALVRKDKVASIQVSKPDAATASPQAPPRPATKNIDVKPAQVAAAPEAAPTPAPPPATPAKPPAPAPVVATPAKPPAPPPMPAKPPAPPPPPVSHPLDVPMPAHLQEHVDGNTYFSDTFQ